MKPEADWPIPYFLKWTEEKHSQGKEQHTDEIVYTSGACERLDL